MIKLTAVERADILEAARRGAKRCRDAKLNLQFSEPQHKIQMHRELEETAKMWESLSNSISESETPTIESPPLSAMPPSELIEPSAIQRTLGEKG